VYSGIVFVGLAPSKQNLHPNIPFLGTKSWTRLQEWIKAVPVGSYGLTNLFRHILKEPPSKEALKKAADNISSYCRGFRYTVALGNEASTALKLAGIEHYKLPHPSGRNRLFNNKAYEPQMLAQFRQWLDRQAV